ncbi:MAG: PLP-dependent lyase/thiolase, partial [Firmicutes bacterium]|nr:PLP-dependent lyase/thiolase [Bacillota bacterium]
DQTIIVQETEYTGAGKHPMPQISFAKQNGIEIMFGDTEDEVPGKNIIFPDSPGRIKIRDFDLDKARTSYVRNAIKNYDKKEISKEDFDFIVKDANSNDDFVLDVLKDLEVTVK